MPPNTAGHKPSNNPIPPSPTPSESSNQTRQAEHTDPNGQRSITQVTTSSPDKTFAIGELLATPLTALLQTRQAEHTDPNGQRWPRSKRHDDATALLYQFN